MSRARRRAGARGRREERPALRAARVRWPVAIALAAIALAAGAAFFARAPVARYLAQRHFSRAGRLIAAGDEQGAASELALTLEADPLTPSAQRLLGELHLRRHELERAFLDLQSYTDAFPDDPEGWADLAEVRLQAAQPEQAEAAITNAVDRAPERKDLRLRRAELRLRIGGYHGAVVDAQAVLQREAGSAAASAILARAGARVDAGGCGPAKFQPSSSETATWPGQLGEMVRAFAVATHQRDWEAAGALVRRARDDYPHTMLAPWLDGVSSLSFSDTDHAERSLREALAISPRSHRPITNLVALWSRTRGPAYAGDQLLAIVERDPAFAYPLPIAAAAYLEEAQPAKAEATIRRMFRVLPESPVPFREVAHFLLKLDRASDAVATAAAGLVRFPADPELLREQARGFSLLGDREAALRSWEAALAARPDDRVAAAELARLLIAVRKDLSSRERALRLVRMLECDAPSEPEVLGAMGLVFLQVANDAPKARGWLEAARDRAPDSPQLRYQLALACARTQDTSAASRELQEALRSGQPFDEEPEARRLLHDLGGPPR